ncbi:hypothetical protein JGH11_01475 [Dysgonomonas sp. Marseille-P4677]|nr:hypothetical protein [Dysgonomonas sp. Marseille-P4677]
MIITSLSACSEDDKTIPDAPPTQPEQQDDDNNSGEKKDNVKLQITIGETKFTATLQDNATAKAFKSLLPMTITMNELNRNEKYYDLPNSLPTAASNSGTIHSGDIMLYGSKTLVLFYKTFSTSYSYTKIGSIDDSSKLKEAIGLGNATVIFELGE